MRGYGECVAMNRFRIGGWNRPVGVAARDPELRELAVFLLFASLVIGAGLGLRSPWPADEPRFVLVARQMWEGGDWWFPRRGQELYSDKPPLFFWLLGAAYAAVRNWNVAFLIPSLLAALGTLGLTYDLGRRLWHHRAGLWAAAAVLCAFQFGYQARRAQIDPVLAGFVMLGFYGIVRHALLGPDWRWYWAGCFAAGLGVISKGVGFLALFALLPYAAMCWRGAAAPGRAWRWAAGALAFLAPIAAWFLPMLAMALTDGDASHRAYLQDLLFRQTATRYFDAWHHHEPAWYYLEVIALMWLPFSLFLPWLLKPWWQAWRARDAAVWLPLATAVLVVLFFSASPGKRDMYVLPALPMLALAAAPFLPELGCRRAVRALLFAFVLVLGATALAAGAAALWGEPGFELKFERARGLAIGSDQADRVWWILLVLGASICALAAWWRPRRAPLLVLAAMGAVWVAYGLGIAPLLDGKNSARDLMREARTVAGPQVEIGLVDWKEQLLLQAIEPTVEFGFKAPVAAQWRDGLAWLHARPGQRRLLVQEASLPPCVDRAQARAVGVANRRAWWLVGADAVGDCPAWRSAQSAAGSGVSLRRRVYLSKT